MKIVTFGEIMLRLKSHSFERLFQTPILESTFGGGEANVAVSLANFGLDAAFITVLPQNAIADACVKELRGFNVDVKNIVRGEGRMGIYFLEAGANQRPSLVIYDRENSAISLAARDSISWEFALSEASWFHITGITPAISQSVADISLDAVKVAKKLGITVSIDLNYRKNLWKYGTPAHEIMPQLLSYADVCIANEEDIQKALNIQPNLELGMPGDHDHKTAYEKLCVEVLQRFQNLKTVAVTLRESINANRNDWSACLHNREKFIVSQKYELTDIVDRVGGGDSFSAGLIYGLITQMEIEAALEFAVAASCLKHSIHGDFNRVSIKEVKSLVGGDKSGRVKR